MYRNTHSRIEMYINIIYMLHDAVEIHTGNIFQNHVKSYKILIEITIEIILVHKILS